MARYLKRLESLRAPWASSPSVVTSLVCGMTLRPKSTAPSERSTTSLTFALFDRFGEMHRMARVLKSYEPFAGSTA